jgi:hypothetical protein
VGVAPLKIIKLYPALAALAIPIKHTLHNVATQKATKRAFFIFSNLRLLGRFVLCDSMLIRFFYAIKLAVARLRVPKFAQANKLNFFQRAGLLKRRAKELNHLFTLRISLTDPIVWATAEFFVWTKGSETGWIVSTIALRPVATKVPMTGAITIALHTNKQKKLQQLMPEPTILNLKT